MRPPRVVASEVPCPSRACRRFRPCLGRGGRRSPRPAAGALGAHPRRSVDLPGRRGLRVAAGETRTLAGAGADRGARDRRGEAPRPARRPAARDLAHGAGRPFGDALRLAFDRGGDGLLPFGVGRAARPATFASCTRTTASAWCPELERASTGAPVRSLEYRLLARDGRAVWVREDSATVRDSKGRAALRPDLPARRGGAEARRRPARAAPVRGARGRLRERGAPLAAGPAPTRRERDLRRGRPRPRAGARSRS